MVNEGEAKRVREIFGLYAKHRSLATMLAELQRRKWTTKSWTTKHGARHAGSVFDKAALLRLLTNAIYIGKVEHKGTIYAGEQAAIVEPGLWDEINTELRAARRGHSKVIRTKQNTLLNGLLFCHSCDQPMVPTYTSKGDRRYRYYVCRTAKGKAGNACPTKSVAARIIEDSVVTQVRSALGIDGAREQMLFLMQTG